MQGNDANETDFTGKPLSHYRVESKLGEGGMGVVYRAFDTLLCRQVALKVLPPDVVNKPALRHRLEQEARTASAISHGHVAHVYEVGDSDGVCFIAMEYVEGKTLKERMKERGLETREILEIAIQVADALDAAHSKGIIHRDLKPSNIMIDGRGDAKVLDFGLARITSELPQADGLTATQTAPGVIMGTAQYMSPEQALGRSVDSRSDIFSFGTVLYEMVTGRMAFRGKSFLEVLMQVVQTEPDFEGHPDQPEELVRIVQKCMDKEPGRRYQATSELLTDLRNLRRLEDSQYATGPVSLEHRPKAAAGPHRARLLKTAVPAAVVLLLTAAAWWYLHRGPVYDSVAVLPMANASGDPELEYVADGLTESLINRISRLRGVTVVSSSSVFRLKSKLADPQTIARQLHVKALLTGNISEKNGVMQVSVELSDPRSNTHIWGDQYSRSAVDAYRIQEDIARDIADRLSSNLSSDERRTIGKRETDSEEASRLFFKGRYNWNKRTVVALKTAVDFFQQAIDKDPAYARAYAGLADSYMLLATVMPPGEAFGKAKAAANRALEIDKNLAEPHATLGYIALHYDWDWRSAETNLKLATELNPNYPTAHSLFARYLSVMGRYPQSVEEMQRAEQLDPLSPSISTGVGLCYYLARHYEESILQYRKTLELEPHFPLAMLDLGDAYAQKRQFPEAIAAFEQALAITPTDAGGLAQMGHAYAMAGRRTDALATLDRLNRLASTRYVSPYLSALVTGSLGNPQDAISALERAYTDRAPQLVFIKTEPALDPIRHEPRFQSLLAHMGLK